MDLIQILPWVLRAENVAKCAGNINIQSKKSVIMYTIYLKITIVLVKAVQC